MPSPSLNFDLSPSPSATIYDQLYNLRRGKSGDHERPHKPALLLELSERHRKSCTPPSSLLQLKSLSLAATPS